MKRLATMALAALALALPATSAAQTDSPLCVPRTTSPRTQLTLVKTEKVDARTTIYSLQSGAVSRLVHLRVVVPEQYLTEPKRSFPVVYHLHGTNNTSTTWNLADLKKYVLADTPVILVMPDGGTTDFYTDWVGSPLGSTTPPPAWDTFHNLELVPWIDKTLRTNGHRAIVGSSMGGFGAIGYPEHHPGLYDAAASLSGAVDIETPAAKAVIPVAYGPCIFGDPILDAANYEASNPTAHVERLRGVSLYVQSGNGLPGKYDTVPSPLAVALEGLIHPMNLNLVAALNAAHIPVTANFYGNGTHPDGVGESRFYDFDGMRAFIAQAMPLMTTSCRAAKTRTFTLPEGATRVRVTVDGKRHAFRRQGRKLRLSLANTADARYRIRITAAVGKRQYTRATHLTTCDAT